MATEKQLLQALDVLTDAEMAPGLETMRAEAVAARKAAKPWVSGRGIQGFGIAERITAGKIAKQLALKVYVEKKLPKTLVKNLVPPEVEVPGVSRKIPTDVEPIGKVELESNTSRVRPAIPGYSVGHVNITAGTYGCLVRRTDDPNGWYILSNSHVLADEGVGSRGDNVIQPGDLDGGAAPGDVIARLFEWVPFQFTPSGYPNLVDAAIARLSGTRRATSAIRIIGVPAGVSNVVRRGMEVQKCGRTTDHTVGIIRDVNYRLALTYKMPGGGTGRVGLRDQVLCTRYTAGGDSGSAVLNGSKKVVGLHFAGSPTTSIFNRIRHVLAGLRINVVTGLVVVP